MSRWLAGTFDPEDHWNPARVAGALAPEAATLIDRPPLRLAYSGPEIASRGPLCVIDGHLDNVSEIRRELDRSHSNGGGAIPEFGELPRVRVVEALLAVAYGRWGGGLLERLRGDFVLLIWDAERGQGLLARDQLGARPCFLHDSGRGLCFASEIRQLLALLPRRPAPDPAGVAHWVAASSRPGPQTLYAGIRRLQPGGVVMLDAHGSREERYWIPRFEEPLRVSDGELAERVRDGLNLAVARRLDPDGKTGVLMSGGLDSSSVAAVCAQQANGSLYACSATFPEHPAADEAELIGELRTTLGLPGIDIEVRPGGLLASALESLVAWQMPLLGWGDFWTLALMRAAASQGVSTVLDGDGGDELLGPRTYLLADRMRAGEPRRALALAYELPGANTNPPRREIARMFGSLALLGALPYRLHDAINGPLARGQAPSWMLPGAVKDLVSSDDPLRWKRLEGPRWWAQAAYGLTCGIEEAGVFEHQRRRAALAGVEARHPLLDLDLVQLGLRQPPLATFDPRFSRPVLRESMAGLLPDAVRLRPGKARFESLIVDCLTGPDGAIVRRLLSGRDSELGAYVDPGALRKTLFDNDRELKERPFRWMWHVWRLLTAECWLRAQAGLSHGSPPWNLQASPARITTRVVVPSYVFPP